MLVPAHTAGQTTEPARRFAWDVARAVLIDRTGGWRWIQDSPSAAWPGTCRSATTRANDSSAGARSRLYAL